MASKHRGDFFGVPVSGITKRYGTQVGSYSGLYWKTWETIDSGGLQKRMKSCHHLRRFSAVSANQDSPAIWLDGWENTSLLALSGYNSSAPETYVDGTYDVSAFNSRAYASMSDKFQADKFNVAVQIAELTELADPLKQIGSALKAGLKAVKKGKLNSLIYSSVKDAAVAAKKDVAKSAASAHLAYAFGVAPLISLAKEGYGNLVRIKKKVDDIMSSQNKMMTSHYKETVRLSAKEYLNYGPDSRGLVIYVARDEYTVDLCATMKYMYSIPRIEAYGQDVTEFVAYLDILGISRPKTVIWNMIPFSFVADWFVNLGDILTQDESLVKTLTLVDDYCISQSARAVPVNYWARDNSTRYLGQTYGVTSYRRDVVAPITSGARIPLQFQVGLTWNQIALSASLLTNLLK